MMMQRREKFTDCPQLHDDAKEREVYRLPTSEHDDAKEREVYRQPTAP